MSIDLGSTFKEIIDEINRKSESGSQGEQGYGFVASVSRPSFTEANWTTYGTVGHTETWASTSVGDCRVGDLFLVIGTATDTGNAHMAIYKNTATSGNLSGTCIGHYIALRGATGAQGANGDKGADGRGISSVSKSEYQYTSGVTYYIIKYTDGTSSEISVPNGSSPRVRGDWESSKIYLTLDIVYYAETGCAYIAKETTSTVPTDTDYWQIISAKGTDGDDGVGISSVVQTTASTADGGDNVITITLTDGTTSTFKVKNGSKGSQGAKGDTGANGTNGKDGVTPTIQAQAGSHINEVGTPTVTASTNGTTTTFTFDYLKGETGSGGGSGGGGGSATLYKHFVHFYKNFFSSEEQGNIEAYMVVYNNRSTQYTTLDDLCEVGNQIVVGLAKRPYSDNNGNTTGTKYYNTVYFGADSKEIYAKGDDGSSAMWSVFNFTDTVEEVTFENVGASSGGKYFHDIRLTYGSGDNSNDYTIHFTMINTTATAYSDGYEAIAALDTYTNGEYIPCDGYSPVYNDFTDMNVFAVKCDYSNGYLYLKGYLPGSSDTYAYELSRFFPGCNPEVIDKVTAL